MTTAEQRIVDLVRSYVGCSLDDSTEDARLRRAALAQLVARQVDDPESVVTIDSNCGMFALGIWKLIGIEHAILRKKYVNGMAMAWLTRIGNDLGMRHAYQGDPSVLRPGTLLFYRTASGAVSKEHVEFLLGELDEHHEADHGGGGRPKNAIAESHGPVLRSSWAGPLWVYFDVPGLLERMGS